LTNPSRAESVSSGSDLLATKPANNTYFPALDGLRALAFLMVFAVHYEQMLWGWAGVDVFFVLSGFLITGILYDSRDDAHRVRNFYVRRALRIFPLYYGVMILLAASYPVFRWQWTWAWLVWPAYVGNFVVGIHPFVIRSPTQLLADFQPLSRAFPSVQLFLGHFWSLCVEEQFYLMWPWVVFWVRDRKKLMYICLACVVICPVMRIIGSHVLPRFMLERGILFRWTPFRVDALLLGGLVALIRRGPSERGLLWAARATSYVLGAMGVVWLILNRGAVRHPGSFVPPSWDMTWGLVFFDLLSAAVVVMALEPGSVTYRVLNLGPLRWIGRISYGAYLFHDIFHKQIGAAMSKVAGHGTAPAALLFTLVLAWASFRWYETPFIRLKERWTRPVRDLGHVDRAMGGFL
jgi:peptidoglycan/LPS O-acetylase OafA/YrhL